MALIAFFSWALVLLVSVAVSAPTSPGPQHIFLLAGQSNMVGHGGLNGAHWDGKVPPMCQPHPDIFRLNADLTWSPAQEPLHKGIFRGMPVTGIGPGMPFARHVLELKPGFGTIGLVPCAYDWTGIEEWSRGYVPQPGHTRPALYRTLIERAQASRRSGGRIAALLWWQGGKDALNETDASLYKGRLEHFFNSVREDLGMPNLPILMIVIPRERAEFVDKVREAQMSLKLPNMISMDPPKLEFEDDHLHATSDSQVIVGMMVAGNYCRAGY